MEYQTAINAQPVKTAKFVHIEKDGSEFVCDLPIEKQFNDGSGVLFYVNNCGLIPYDTYMAQKHSKEEAAKREKKGKE